jgi:uncharacterized coiled-coil DUF342 family protein
MRYGSMTVASSPLGKSAEKRESGFQRAGDDPALPMSADEHIQASNQELIDRAREMLKLPIVVLTEQRDNALRRLAGAERRSEARRLQLVAEQDKFISFLMSEQEQKVAELEHALQSTHQEALQKQSLARSIVSAGPLPSAAGADTQLVEQIEALQQALDAATAEVEETRVDASRLQEERDEAIRAIDDAHIELMSEVESARDDCFQLETRLDEAQRLLEDARDQARDEADRFNEELSEARRELDERNEEVRRLRARVASHVTETMTSRPPPPPADKELERARSEAQRLRQQVIATKRDLARVTHELEAQKAAPRTARIPLTRSGALPETRRFEPRVGPERRPGPLGITGPGSKRD